MYTYMHNILREIGQVLYWEHWISWLRDLGIKKTANLNFDLQEYLVARFLLRLKTHNLLMNDCFKRIHICVIYCVKLVRCYIGIISFYGSETWALRKLEIFILIYRNTLLLDFIYGSKPTIFLWMTLSNVHIHTYIHNIMHEISQVVYQEHCILWLRYLDIKKIGAEAFEYFRNMVLEENGDDKMAKKRTNNELIEYRREKDAYKQHPALNANWIGHSKKKLPSSWCYWNTHDESERSMRKRKSNSLVLWETEEDIGS